VLLVFNFGLLYVHSSSEYTCLQSELFVFLNTSLNSFIIYSLYLDSLSKLSGFHEFQGLQNTGNLNYSQAVYMCVL
jgi:hypothetical protein